MPNRIANVPDFNQLTIDPNNWNKSFILTADVNLAGLTFTQAPIAPDTSTSDGFQGTQFKGVFDGNSHTISNLTIIASTKDFIGLFGYVGSGGQIQNLGVEDVNITGPYYVGGLTGYNSYDTLTACFWDIQTSEISDGVGNVNPDPNGAMGKTTAEMMTLSTFTDANGLWDFLGETTNGTDDYWRMCVDGVDYPRLTWEYIQDGDFACPDGVGFDDLQRFGDDWLLTYSTPFYGADANGDKTVNFLDFAILADNWLNP